MEVTTWRTLLPSSRQQTRLYSFGLWTSKVESPEKSLQPVEFVGVCFSAKNGVFRKQFQHVARIFAGLSAGDSKLEVGQSGNFPPVTPVLHIGGLVAGQEKFSFSKSVEVLNVVSLPIGPPNVKKGNFIPPLSDDEQPERFLENRKAIRVEHANSDE
ncbi:MAG: hypothetical protein H7838_07565 [Magnetococcus sp. DMHC-8]